MAIYTPNVFDAHPSTISGLILFDRILLLNCDATNIHIIFLSNRALPPTSVYIRTKYLVLGTTFDIGRTNMALRYVLNFSKTFRTAS